MTRALVLGGGGPVGIAWESGLIAGLAEKGVDLSSADYIVGTSYDDTPSAPKITVINPLGQPTTVTYNPQGQPISVTDPINNTSRTAYFSSGDVQSTTDGNGKTTTFQTDPDGRVTSVTSPLNELTNYHYDALDNVTDVYVDPAGFNLHTNYTYDLIGGMASYTTPRGEMTKITHTAALDRITVTDPPPGRATTVTNIDSQGGGTDYTDKRGMKTSYGYDPFGRLLSVTFNDSTRVTAGIDDADGAYDALDRPETLLLWNGSTLLRWPAFTYDSLGNVLTEGDFSGANGSEYESLTYQYDANGRRTSLAPAVNGNAEPTINYGYDCADDLVSMSNDGSALQSCSPSNNVTGGDSSTQIGFFYLEAGLMDTTLSNGVVTFDSFDGDERVTTRDYFSYPDGVLYGDLTYQRDADGRVIDKGGSFAAVNLPPGDSASYSTIDQLSTFGGNSTNPDVAGNILNDPLLLLTYTWNARNQLSAMSGGVTETYDSLGRREGSGSSTANLSLLHDGSSLIGSADSVSGNAWNFLPGGLAGSLTSGGVTTTWVPLLDPDGSTIALVNAAQVDSGPTTTITYDPSGVASVSGLSNSFPFLYQGLEHEVTDPGQLDFEQSGNVYNPQIQRQLSLTGPQGLSVPNGGFGDFGDHGAPRQSGNSLGQTFSDIGTVAAPVSLLFLGTWIPLGAIDEGGATAVPAFFISQLFDLFGLFGDDSDPPPPPRQLKHGRHPIYSFLGIRLIAGEQSAARSDTSDSPQASPVSAPLQRFADNVQLVEDNGPSPPASPKAPNDCDRNVKNAKALCAGAQAFLGPLLYPGCPLGVRACYVAPTPYTCGMAVGLCGSAVLLNYTCYRAITEAKAGCK